jgi:hypothetical protein
LQAPPAGAVQSTPERANPSITKKGRKRRIK